ncbi:Homeobox protein LUMINIDEPENDENS [Acorus calamus]|uniref:Homeobox protein LUMINIDEPENDENS n=1 Tax=Acorus calamus TaxID=4465 RepID=A0AAV9F1G9_ACOCL|nr:Homeobox protein LUMINIDEPENDENS [Acorus calamus]
MELVKVDDLTFSASLGELVFANSAESFGRFLESQRDLFHGQVEQLQRIVVTQCKLTGVNPLSQEMAAGALSIKIGKRPRDLLNSKAIKYMQSVFSIKDTMSKKETREISALYGVTLTQVRDFFSGQRSKVRKLVQLSREKEIRSTPCLKSIEQSLSSNDGLPLRNNALENFEELKIVDQSNQVPLNNVSDMPAEEGKQAPLNNVNAVTCEDNKHACINIVNIAAIKEPKQAPLNIFDFNPLEGSLTTNKMATLSSLYSKPTQQVSSIGEQDPLNHFDLKPAEEGFAVSNHFALNNLDPKTAESGSAIGKQASLIFLDHKSAENGPVTGKQAPLNSLVTKPAEEGPSCTSQEDAIPDIDDFDQKFVRNIFSLMQKEETFSGQVKLLEWILQIQNSAVLDWFLEKGGVMILAKWLNEAALEEQTTALLIMLKAMKKPLVAKSSGDVQKEIIRKQRHGIFVHHRIREILSDESWQSKVDLPEDFLSLTHDGSGNSRNPEQKDGLKLLCAPGDDPDNRRARTILPSRILCMRTADTFTGTKVRRKVLLVEEPGRNTSGKSPQGAKTVTKNQSRPMSADDIQKAKMRAMFMQNKYGKITASPNESISTKVDDQKVSVSQTDNISPALKPYELKADQDEKPEVTSLRIIQPPEPIIDPEPGLALQESLSDMLKRDQVPWRTPPAPNHHVRGLNAYAKVQTVYEMHRVYAVLAMTVHSAETLNDTRECTEKMKLDPLWRIGVGENCKEVEVQTERIRREKETFYDSIQDIPPNPKDPWDIEMDYDDSLTLEILMEQPTDADDPEAFSPHDNKSNASDGTPAALPANPSPIAAPLVNGTVSSAVAPPEPDLELLAVLLKNPELVFALTSGQASGLSNEQTVALLDALKSTGASLSWILNGSLLAGKNQVAKQPEQDEPTSLPSPTPPSERLRSEWRSEPSFPANAIPSPPTLVLLPQKTTMSLPHLTAPVKPPSPQQQPPPILSIPNLHQYQPTQAPVFHRDTSNFDQLNNRTTLSPPPPVSSSFTHNSLAPPLLQNSIKPQTNLQLQQRSLLVEPPIPPMRSNWQQVPVHDGSRGLSENPVRRTYNQSNYNIHSSGPGRSTPDVIPPRSSIGDSGCETWSPGRSPTRSPEHYSSRRDHEWGGYNSRRRRQPVPGRSVPASFGRRFLTGVGSASLVAVGANFGGVTSSLLGISPELGRGLRLDVLYPVGGYSRCFDSVQGFEFIYPANWVGDQTLLYRAVGKAESTRSLDPPPLDGRGLAIERPRRNDVSEPSTAFGPPGSNGELNVSVIVSPVSPGFRIEAFGGPKEVGEAVIRTISGSRRRSDVKASLIDSTVRGDTAKKVNYYMLEFMVESPSFRRHNVAVCTAYNGRLFTLNAQAPESDWPKVKEEFYTVANSFNLTSLSS